MEEVKVEAKVEEYEGDSAGLGTNLIDEKSKTGSVSEYSDFEKIESKKEVLEV